MPEYKLTYLNWPGRGEVIRYLFSMAGVEFQDIRVEREQMPGIRHKTPFGQVPMLEVDGKALCQSQVIARYLAQQFGFDGSTEWEKARAAMIAACCDDGTSVPARKLFYERDPKRKEENQEKYRSEQLPAYMNCFDKLLKENNGGTDGYFVGIKLTYADVAFYFHLTYVPPLVGASVDWGKWPALDKVRDNVKAHPGVQKWESKRDKQ